MTIGAGGVVILLLAGLLPACTQEAATAGAEVELRFAWPEQGTVAVVETRSRDGVRMQSEYRLEWSPGEAAGSILVRVAGLRVRSIQDKPLGEEEQRMLAQSMAKLGLSMDMVDGVGLLVDEEGYLLDTLGVAEILRTMAAAAALRHPDAPTPEQMEGNLQTEFAGNVLAQLGERYWTPWVGGWAGRTLPLDEQWHEEAEYPFPGTDLSVRVSEAWTSHGLESDADGRWLRLRREMVYDEDSLAAAMFDAAKEFLRDKAPSDEMPRIRRVDRFEILTDVDSLRPRKALHVMELSAGPKQRKDQRKWEFDWSSATTR